MRKLLVTLAAAASLAGPAVAQASTQPGGAPVYTTPVVSVLIGLLLPAVQAAREAARR